MKNGIIIIICLCCISGLCNGQNKKVDSLLHVLKTAREDSNKVKILNNLASDLQFSNPDSSILLSTQALQIAEKIKWQAGKANSHRNLGCWYRGKGDYTLSLEHFSKAFEICNDLEKSGTNPKSQVLSLKSKINCDIGIVYVQQGNYTKALDYFLKGLKLSEELGDKRSQCGTLGNLGIVYEELGNHPKALDYEFKALKMDEELGNKRGIETDIGNIGIIYKEQGDDQKALDYYFKALKMAEELGDKTGIARNHGNIGTAYFKQGNYTEALKNHIAASKIFEEIGDQDNMATGYYNIGNDYLKMKKNREASLYLNKGLSLAKKTGSIDGILGSYLGLTRLDSAQGNFKQAFEYHKLYINYRDSLLNRETTQKTMQIQMQYEFDKKESLAKAEQEKKDALALKELQKQKLMKYFLMAGIGLVLVLFFFVYRTYRARQLLRLNDIRNKIAGDLHDDIGSTLNSISIFSEVAKKKGENYEEALEMIGDASRKVIEAMSDIVWTINAENDNFEKIIFRMSSLAYNLFRAKNIEFTFQADDSLGKKKLSLEERRNFYLIFKEAVNNLVKYSNAAHASIKLTDEMNRIILRIRDDGTGFDPSQANAGNGLKSMKRRANEMGAKFVIDSHVGGGTQIELILKA